MDDSMRTRRISTRVRGQKRQRAVASQWISLAAERIYRALDMNDARGLLEGEFTPNAIGHRISPRVLSLALELLIAQGCVEVTMVFRLDPKGHGAGARASGRSGRVDRLQRRPSASRTYSNALALRTSK
jgi:hypothetical protein